MNVTFKWIGGATWILTIGGATLGCDPVLCPRGHVQDYKYFKTKRLNEPEYSETDLQKVNLWLLTHNHEDHIDAYGIKAIARESTVVSHRSVKPLLRKAGFDGVTYLGWDEKASFEFENVSVAVTAVPAIHAKRKYFSGKIGNGNGYFIQASGSDFSFSIYVTGDSVFDGAQATFFSERTIDLIIANAGSAMLGDSFLSYVVGRITNNTGDIKKMLSALNPKVLIPVHWGTFSHYKEVIDMNSFINCDTVKILHTGETVRLV